MSMTIPLDTAAGERAIWPNHTLEDQPLQLFQHRVKSSIDSSIVKYAERKSARAYGAVAKGVEGGRTQIMNVLQHST